MTDSTDKIYLVEFTPYDSGSAAEVTLYYATEAVHTEPGDSPANVTYAPRVLQALNYETTLFGRDVLEGRSSSFGTIRLNNTDGGIDDELGYAWDGRSVTIYELARGAAFSTRTEVFTGKVDNIDWDEQSVRVRTRDPRTQIDKVVQDTLYDNTVTFSGTEGRPKPLAYGHVREAEPELLDETNLIYQVHESAVEEIEAVYDKGAGLQDDGDLTDYGSFSSLTDAGILADPQDGVRIFILDETNSTREFVWQLDLKRRWALTSVVGADIPQVDVSSELADPEDAAFSSDGTKMYVVGSTEIIYQYDLSTAWEVGSASYASKSYDVSALGSSRIHGIEFKDDGTKLYTLGLNDDTVYQHTLSTAWDLSTASYDSVSFSVTSEAGNPHELLFKPDGTRMYVTDTSVSSAIYQYDLGTAWDLSTAVYNSVSSSIIGTEGAALSGGGTDLYAQGSTGTVSHYTLATAWDVGSLTLQDDELYLGQIRGITSPDIHGTIFGADGKRLYVLDQQTEAVLQLNLGSSYDLAIQEDVGSPSNNVRAITFKTDGTEMYVTYDFHDFVSQFTLSTAWDVTSATHASNFDVTSETDEPYGVLFKDDGLKMYVLGKDNARLYQYSLSTAWDVSTASYDSTSLDLSNEDTSPTDVYFRANGAQLFMVGSSNDTVYSYTLTTAWDLSTATAETATLSISDTSVDPSGLFLKTNGEELYISDKGSQNVIQYNLTTAWDLSTAVLITTVDFSDLVGTLWGIYLRDEGNDGGPLTAGGFLTDEANGQFRLGALPDGTVTVDLQGDNTGGYVSTAAEILDRVAQSKLGVAAGDIDSTSISTLASDQSAVHGLYIAGDQPRGPDVFDQLMRSIGGWWTFSPTGQLKVGRLEVPASGDSVETLTGDDITGSGLVRQNAGRVLSKIRLGYDRTWTVQPAGQLAAALTTDEKDLRSKAYRFVTAEDATIDTEHLLAQTFERLSLFDTKANASTEVSRLLTLHGEQRDIYQVSVGPRLFDFEVGQVVTVDYDRFGLSGGADLTIIGVIEDTASNTTKLILWG